MTGDATASRGSFFVMGVLLDSAGAWTIQRKRTVIIQAQLVRRLSQLPVIIRTMHTVAAKHVTPRGHITLCTKSHVDAAACWNTIGTLLATSSSQRLISFQQNQRYLFDPGIDYSGM